MSDKTINTCARRYRCAAEGERRNDGPGQSARRGTAWEDADRQHQGGGVDYPRTTGGGESGFIGSAGRQQSPDGITVHGSPVEVSLRHNAELTGVV